MTEVQLLTDIEFGEAIHQFEHTAFRLELQDSYLEAEETGIFEAWRRGEPYPPTRVPELNEWYRRVSAHVHQGKRIERVRVQQNPPTDYQCFERWLDRWNLEAGEVMRYLTVDQAHKIGLLPAAGNTDWWLLDSIRLVALEFAPSGRRIRNKLITEPKTVLQACAWRDLAVHHSVRSEDLDVAA